MGATLALAVVLVGAIGAIYFLGEPEALHDLQERIVDNQEDLGATTAPSAEAIATPTPNVLGSTLNTTAIEEHAVALTNEERRIRGIKPLEHDPALSDIARGHSENMLERGYSSRAHVFDGLDPTGRANAANYPCYGISENIHKVSKVQEWMEWPWPFSLLLGASPSKVSDSEGVAWRLVREWVESPGHRQNLLDTGAYAVGIGVAIEVQGDQEWVYATQNFSPCP